MNIPLKKLSTKKYHGSCVLSDNYSWVDQKDILSKKTLKTSSDVKEYIERIMANSQLFSDIRVFKKIFDEIKSKIKLEDTSLKFRDKRYYWNKTEKKEIIVKIRQIIDGSKPRKFILMEIWKKRILVQIILVLVV